MKIIYDLQTDTLNLILRKAKVKESEEIREGLIVDYDEQGRISAIEMLEASKSVADPDQISYQLKCQKIKCKISKNQL